VRRNATDRPTDAADSRMGGAGCSLIFVPQGPQARILALPPYHAGSMTLPMMALHPVGRTVLDVISGVMKAIGNLASFAWFGID